LRIGKRNFNHGLFAVAAFVALYFFSVPFPPALAAALFGGLVPEVPGAFRVGHGSSEGKPPSTGRVFLGVLRFCAIHWLLAIFFVLQGAGRRFVLCGVAGIVLVKEARSLRGFRRSRVMRC